MLAAGYDDLIEAMRPLDGPDLAQQEDGQNAGGAMAAMLDGLLLDRLAHPPQDEKVVVAAVRWLLNGPPR
jgi:hypothetical protein